MAYLLETKGDRCTLTDDSTGLVLQWRPGGFRYTLSATFRSTAPALSVLDPAELKMFTARNQRRMGEWLAENHPDKL